MINLNRLKKNDIIWLSQNRCKHRHYFIEHQNCFSKENPKESPLYERIGTLDIEASNLNADFGIVFSYAIKEKNGKILGRSLTRKEMENRIYDKELMRECCENMKKFDRLIGYYCGDRRFDIPFLRTRAVYWKLPFPLYKQVKVTDLYSVAKNKFNLHRRRLETLCSFFGIKAKGHPMKPETWFEAMAGDEKALNYIWAHNIEDVVSTEKLYDRIIEYSNKTETSI